MNTEQTNELSSALYIVAYSKNIVSMIFMMFNYSLLSILLLTVVCYFPHS